MIAKLVSRFATKVGVAESTVSISVSAGSVLLRINVWEPDATIAKHVGNKIAPLMKSPEAASILLGVDVQSTPVLTVLGAVVVLSEAPPPPPTGSDGLAAPATGLTEAGDGNGQSHATAALLGVFGALFGVLLCAFVSRYVLRTKRKRREAETRSNLACTIPTAAIIMPPLVSQISPMGRPTTWKHLGLELGPVQTPVVSPLAPAAPQPSKDEGSMAMLGPGHVVSHLPS